MFKELITLATDDITSFTAHVGILVTDRPTKKRCTNDIEYYRPRLYATTTLLCQIRLRVHSCVFVLDRIKNVA